MAMLMSSVLNFLMNPAFALLPILVLRHFRGDALQLATLNTALGIGFVAGGLILGAWGGFKRRIYTAVGGLAAMAIGSLLIGVAPADGCSADAGAAHRLGRHCAFGLRAR